MSAESMRKSFIVPLLRKLEVNRRKEVEGQKGQILLIDDLNSFTEALSTIYPSASIDKNSIAVALKKGKNRALKLQEDFRKKDRRRFNLVARKFVSVYATSHVLGDNAFLLFSFATVNQVKTAILESLVKQKAITSTQRHNIKSQIHRGHGARGTAVSQVSIAKSLSKAADKGVLGHLVSSLMSTDNMSGFHRGELFELSVRYNQVVTKTGKLRADYFSIINFQSASENTTIDAPEEKAIKDAFVRFVKEDFIKNIPDIKGSSSLKDKIEQHTVETIATNLFKAKVKTKASRRQGSYGVVRGKTKRRGKDSARPVRLAGPFRLGAAAASRKKAESKRSPAAEALRLVVQINRRLPKVVANNMGSPKLNYVTGRFANSVRATSAIATRSGLSVGYEYQMDPYQVFEIGLGRAPWATRNRDPRKIIGESIREIASALTTNKIIARRD